MNELTQRVKDAREKARGEVLWAVCLRKNDPEVEQRLDRLITLERAEAAFTEHGEWHCGKAQDECYDERERRLEAACLATEDTPTAPRGGDRP